jgi:AMP-polyphosphate phosphotransferase
MEIQRDARDRSYAPPLSEVPIDLALKAKEERQQTRLAQDRMQQLRLQLGGKLGDATLGPPVTVIFEGWDAAGKGGAIGRLVGRLDARHVRVVQFAAPTSDELRHHWLGRFWPHLPGWGGMAVYDRSWYGRVLVERVEGFASEEAWQRAYKEIREFERTQWSEGMVFVKFWLQISDQEQLQRFTGRGDDPLRSYKLTDEDWRNRQKRPKYEAAVEDMFAETSIPESPWIVIAAEDKRYARVEVLRQTIRRIEEGMRQHGMEPLPTIEP